MKSAFLCLVFILTSTVIAQAADNGTTHINTQKWITTFAGEAEVAGLPVTANLDESQAALQIPDAMAGTTDTLVPSLLPVIRKEYRLNLVVSQSPRVNITFPVVARTVSIDGSQRFAYVSNLDANQDFHFVITTAANGSLHVAYTRRDAGGQITGEFELASVPHILK